MNIDVTFDSAVFSVDAVKMACYRFLTDLPQTLN